MGVTIMSEKPVLLEKLGVGPDYLAKIKQHKIKMAVGFKNIKFLDQNGKVLSEYPWPFGVNPADIMSGKIASSMLKQVCFEVQALITVAVAGGPPAQIPVPVVVTASEEPEPVTAEVMAKLFPNMKVAVPAVSPEEMVKQVAVPLKDATALYQPVRGTDKSSRYFVAAINQDIRVAVRITGNAVSVRVEGNLTAEVKKALIEQGLDDKGSYLSKHRTTANTTPAKYVGALLMATGMAFDTPLPSMEVIKNAK